jgi:hypothetical protein
MIAVAARLFAVDMYRFLSDGGMIATTLSNKSSVLVVSVLVDSSSCKQSYMLLESGISNEVRVVDAGCDKLCAYISGTGKKLYKSESFSDSGTGGGLRSF